MTVQELIDKLQSIPDKSLLVVIEDGDYPGCEEVESVTIKNGNLCRISVFTAESWSDK